MPGVCCVAASCEEQVRHQLPEGPWIEIGWVERSFFATDGPQLYTAVVSRSRSFAPIYYSPTTYRIVPGRFYLFRMRTCTGGTALCASVLWRRNGVTSWEPLRANPDLTCASGTLCRFEYFLEVYSEQSADPHPGLNDAERVRFRALRVRNSSGFVPPVDLSAQETAPYLVCAAAGSSDPTGFDARRVASC